MLASLLPGLRDLRVPLTTGLLWLFVLWLAFFDLIPKKEEATGLAAAVYRTAGAFGPAALTAALSFVAYVIGILLARPTARLVEAVAAALDYPRERNIRSGKAGDWYPYPATRPKPLSFSTFDGILRLADDTAREALAADHVPYPIGHWTNEATAADDKTEIARAHLIRAVEDDIPLVATRLLAHNRELFDRYDRADAEAAFRFVVALPIIAASILIPLRVGMPWWGYILCIAIGVTLAVFLVMDGRRKQVESNDAIYQAVFIGEVTFPTIDNIRQDLRRANPSIYPPEVMP